MLRGIFLFAFLLLIISLLASIHNVNSFSLSPRTNSSNFYSFPTLEIGSLLTWNSSHTAQLYTFGGEVDNGPGDFSSSASMFNSFSRKWQSISSMPTAKTQFCGAVLNNKVYLFGGFSGGRKSLIKLKESHVYDTSTDTYKVLRPMPEKRESCGAAVLNGYVYVAGGSKGSDASIHLSSVIRYNIKTGQWSTVRSMNTPRRGLQLVEFNRRLYAIGGLGLNTVEVYDESADRWSFVAKMQTQHNYFGAAVHDGKIYVIDVSGLEVYSPDTNHWNVLAKPDNFALQTLASMNDKLWTVGGSYKIGTQWKGLKTVYTYDTAAREWTKQQDMDVARQFHCAFVVNH